MTSKANDKPQPKGKEKRPWSKPRIRVIEMDFTASGFNPHPANDEVNDGDGSTGGDGSSYRSS